MIKSLSVIFPLYNEEKRLNKLFQEIKKFNFFKKKNIEFIFVNDGSNDNSNLLIKEFIKKHHIKINLKLISYNTNRGKGYALKKGVAIAKYQWIITTDIDLSVKLEQLKIWIKKKLISHKTQVYFGSRLLKHSIVDAKRNRKIIGFIFNVFLRLILNSDILNIKDTQCGFKLYKKNIAKKVFSKITEEGYIHDVEILILLKKKKIFIKELPVKWEHKSGSKINLFTDSLIMLKNIIRLKKKYKIY